MPVLLPHIALWTRLLVSRGRQSWQHGSQLHTLSRLQGIRPYILADVGEGITECEIVQWFVQPGATVAQFDKICEIQHDKALVEITSRYDGVVKKLHYEQDDIAIVGKPLLDIDVLEDTASESAAGEHVSECPGSEPIASQGEASLHSVLEESSMKTEAKQVQLPMPKDDTALATPATRHIAKQLGIDIALVKGTGRDQRVTKEDLHNYSAAQKSVSCTSSSPAMNPSQDRTIPIVGIQAMRKQLNSRKSTCSSPLEQTTSKLSHLAFIIKAVSMALTAFPSLNAHLDVSADSERKPVYTHKAAHKIGIAIDTPSGLVVPVISNVQTQSIQSIDAELSRLASLARSSKLAPSDFNDATFTISNIGSIGGGVVSPVIVSPQVAILAVGRAHAVPAFDEQGKVVRREEAIFSWSADHRVCDGAVVARAAQMVKIYLENIEQMVISMR